MGLGVGVSAALAHSLIEPSFRAPSVHCSLHILADHLVPSARHFLEAVFIVPPR